MADYVAKWRADTRTQARFSFLIRRFRERPVRDHCSRSCLVAKWRVICRVRGSTPPRALHAPFGALAGGRRRRLSSRVNTVKVSLVVRIAWDG